VFHVKLNIITSSAIDITMTSADIREVLSISGTAPSQKKQKKKALVDPTIKNATGITRELYSLLGEGTPPIAFIKQDRFKEKPKLNKKAASWYHLQEAL
jgi:DNA methyltransferase 1-associated protein 1